MVTRTYQTQLLQWASSNRDELAIELINGGLDEDTLEYLVSERGAPIEVRCTSLSISDFDGVLRHVRTALGEKHIVIRMMSLSKSKDLTAPGLATAVKRIKALCPILLLVPCTTASVNIQSEAASVNIKSEVKSEAASSPSPTCSTGVRPGASAASAAELHNVAESDEVRHAMQEIDPKKQRGNKLSEAHSYRQSAGAIVGIFHATLEKELQLAMSKDLLFEMDNHSFGVPQEQEFAGSIAMMKIFGPLENNWLRGKKAEALTYSQRVAVGLGHLRRLRPRWISRRKMTLNGARPTGNLIDAQDYLKVSSGQSFHVFRKRLHPDPTHRETRGDNWPTLQRHLHSAGQRRPRQGRICEGGRKCSYFSPQTSPR